MCSHRNQYRDNDTIQIWYRRGEIFSLWIKKKTSFSICTHMFQITKTLLITYEIILYPYVNHVFLECISVSCHWNNSKRWFNSYWIHKSRSLFIKNIIHTYVYEISNDIFQDNKLCCGAVDSVFPSKIISSTELEQS